MYVCMHAGAHKLFVGGVLQSATPGTVGRKLPAVRNPCLLSSMSGM